jgi:hypothetical protein
VLCADSRAIGHSAQLRKQATLFDFQTKEEQFLNCALARRLNEEGHLPKSVVSAMLSFEQRHTLAESVIRLLETFRDDLFPGVATWESFGLLLILHRIAHMNQLGRAANASALAWSTGIPRTTVRRRLAELRRTGIIEQRGSCYLLSATFMNHARLLRGFKRRREMVRHLSKYLAETAN